MAEPDDGKLTTRALVKGWCAALAVIAAGVVLYWDIGGLVDEDETGWLRAHHEALGLGAGVFGILFALALTFHGTGFGFRVQSLLLAGVCGAIAFVFATKGIEEGWGVGSGALTFIFSLFALLKLKDVMLGRGPDEAE